MFSRAVALDQGRLAGTITKVGDAKVDALADKLRLVQEPTP